MQANLEGGSPEVDSLQQKNFLVSFLILKGTHRETRHTLGPAGWLIKAARLDDSAMMTVGLTIEGLKAGDGKKAMRPFSIPFDAQH